MSEISLLRGLHPAASDVARGLKSKANKRQREKRGEQRRQHPKAIEVMRWNDAMYARVCAACVVDRRSASRVMPLPPRSACLTALSVASRRPPIEECYLQ